MLLWTKYTCIGLKILSKITPITLSILSQSPSTCWFHWLCQMQTPGSKTWSRPHKTTWLNTTCANASPAKMEALLLCWTEGAFACAPTSLRAWPARTLNPTKIKAQVGHTLSKHNYVLFFVCVNFLNFTSATRPTVNQLGNWSCWSSWSSCSGGKRSRTRQCKTDGVSGASCTGDTNSDEHC